MHFILILIKLLPKLSNFNFWPKPPLRNELYKRVTVNLPN